MKILKYALIIIVVGAIGLIAYRLLFLKNFTDQSKAQISSQLEEARKALADFDPHAAHDSFVAIDTELQNVKTEADKFGFLNIASFFGTFSKLPALLTDLTGISGTAVHISEDVSFLKENAIQLMLAGRGSELIERLKIFNEKLGTLSTYVTSVDSSNTTFDQTTKDKLVELQTEISSTQKVISSLIGFVDTPEPRRLLILFQNPTEQRPAGGFIGSYAVVTLDKLSIADISIRDIYDPDGQLDLKVIPPQILQMITTTWGARDANWFFDFPTSAQKVIYFLNNSKIYSEKNITFSGAVAVNTNVLTDIIGLLGPIPLPEYGTDITKENFLGFVQKEVESGADKKVNQPKKIIQVLAPKIFEKLGNLSATDKQALVKLLEYHLSHKNIMAYVDDPEIESYSKTAGVAGEVVTPSKQAVSEYLAVVNTNIAGGKSDAFIKQHIDFKSAISGSGEISNLLTLTRIHTGQNQKEWWYTATNKDYLQIYTPVGSRAVSSTGRDAWPIDPKHSYTGFQIDPDVENVESTDYFLKDLGLDRFIAFDKTVFAAWLNTAAGKTKTFTLSYTNPRKLNPESGLPYEFIFEKQSGASTTLSFTITAPPNYKWKELNSPILTYQSDDPPGRVSIRQTLIPITNQ